MKEDGIAANGGHARFVADVRAELVVQRVMVDVVKLGADVLNEGDGADGVVLGDIISDVVQVTFDKVREFQPHYFAVPAASVMAWYLRSRRSNTSSAATPGVLS